jgi:hypothetical protein
MSDQKFWLSLSPLMLWGQFAHMASIRYNGISLTGLTLSLFCACPKPGSEFSTSYHMLWFFFFLHVHVPKVQCIVWVINLHFGGYWYVIVYSTTIFLLYCDCQFFRGRKSESLSEVTDTLYHIINYLRWMFVLLILVELLTTII